ncbi:MAG TPA: BON domain-containing protein [Bryobacteraceae bacterium]|jgi:hyperosmotically inducible protein|nr:BON domain-containing protein [Bryobacteraceae bacterium]
MKFKIVLFTAIAAVAFTGCGSSSDYPDVTGNVKDALKANGLGQVNVSQDRQKGVVTLSGTLPSDADKAKAEQLAKNEAGNQVVADEIAVAPPGNEHDTKTANSDIDKAIEKNLDAALIQNGLKKAVNYSVKNGVVTLTGDVKTQALRNQAAEVAKSVPNVAQVVNEIQLKNQPATSH